LKWFGFCLVISGATEPAYKLKGFSRGKGGGDWGGSGLRLDRIGFDCAEYAGRYSEGLGDRIPGLVVEARGSSVEGWAIVSGLEWVYRVVESVSEEWAGGVVVGLE
jgi:hypothetical protein